MTKRAVDHDAIVIGAGFSGLRSIWGLRQLGLTVKCFDAALDVGGTWYWNRYPGARSDCESHTYVFNFAPELLDDWDFSERYPSQDELQRYFSRVADRYDLRRHIEFGTRVTAAHYDDSEGTWTITTSDGMSSTCRYFVVGTGITSIPKEPDFPGIDTFEGECYVPARWPTQKVNFEGKRVGIVGTGSTGIQLIPKVAHAASELTVFQRSPNYVAPGRNHPVDELRKAEIKRDFGATWELARKNPNGHAVTPSGKTIRGISDAEELREGFEYGWELGVYNFQIETYDDIFMDPEANLKTTDFIRSKIRSVVKDPAKARILCPTHPYGAKRPPCGHQYYETFNRPNVNLVDISQDEIQVYDRGIRTSSGAEYELDMIIPALGFDAITGAIEAIDIVGREKKPLKDHWSDRVRTYAGILVSGFPNLFIVCGPHTPIGNAAITVESSVDWITKTIGHMRANGLATADVSKQAETAWSDEHDGLWNSLMLAEPAKENRYWAVGANIPGKPHRILVYFGGHPAWNDLIQKEAGAGWPSVEFTRLAASGGGDSAGCETVGRTISVGGWSVTAEKLESVVVPLQSGDVGLSLQEKFRLSSRASARYIERAVNDIRKRGLAVPNDHKSHWWRVCQDFVNSEPGRALIQDSPDTQDGLDQLTSRIGLEGEAIKRIGSDLVGLLTGEIDPISHVLKDDLLFRLYLSDDGIRPNTYAAEFTRLLASRDRGQRILEVGAGTGGTTKRILAACSPNGDRFCSEYTYTDVSPGFFKAGGTTLKEWENLLTFKTLDIEKDPAKQGFAENSYDLVIAAHVIHATPSLTDTLGNVRRLLKPGGVLALVELTRLTPYFNMVFGMFPGWWSGVEEGRVESPLQSAAQWSRHLKAAGFSGVDLVAYDVPGPERHCALILSTAVDTSSQ
ncbi:putative cyclohexanone monooxygenase [Diaporthe ampelina]|uniref:Putative cyclohexanone monooxygenase n=1 Tax=Diaporthe ampelina TaxID=1214573 RepID=A0A0G2F442_9PEZI|nr:putative cyclohexanone monooxygenase [Diaporthe ampelina]